VFHSVGSGKTLTAVAIMNCLLTKHPDEKVRAYVLTPKSVIAQFKAEINRAKLDPSIASRIEVWSPFMWLNRVEKKVIDPTDCIIIIDEAHHFKTPLKEKPGKNFGNGKSDIPQIIPVYTWKLLNAAKKAKKIAMLTATPAVNRAKEIVNYMVMVNNSHISDLPLKINEYETFAKASLSKETLDTYLRCKFSTYNESHIDFPKKIIKVINVRMSKRYGSAYMQIADDQITSFNILNAFPKNIKAFLNGIRTAVNKITHLSPKIKWAQKKNICRKR
jgi:hypothetical protein